MRLMCVPLVVLVTSTSLAQSPAAVLSRRIEYWNPAWSPDGRALVFESTLDGRSSIYLINHDGSGLRRLTTDTSANYQPDWSPDGRRIVFSSDRGGHGDLYLMNADGTAQTRLTTMASGMYYRSSFSPDGRWIVFQGRPDNSLTRDRIFIINADGTGLRQLTDSAYGAEGPRWMPDGRTIRFLQVPYPKRLWREMQEADMRQARSAQQIMIIRTDGSGLSPSAPSGPEVAWSLDRTRGFFVDTSDGSAAVFETRATNGVPRRIVSTDVVPAGFEPSPDGSLLAYTRSSGGYAGLYVYDVGARSERLLAGGPAVGPLGYLRTANLTAISDTFDTYTSSKTGGGRTASSASFVRVLRRVGAQRWELSDTWSDSGRVNTRQSVRTGDGTLATEIETVRAEKDSASLLVSPSRVTAWVVPEGQPARLFDGPPAGERFATTIVLAAIAKTQPAVGAIFQAPNAGLYAGNPLQLVVDTLRVVARDTVPGPRGHIAVIVIERNTSRFWVDEGTGGVVAARGNAGPQRWWWHIKRGVRLREQ